MDLKGYFANQDKKTLSRELNIPPCLFICFLPKFILFQVQGICQLVSRPQGTYPLGIHHPDTCQSWRVVLPMDIARELTLILRVT